MMSASHCHQERTYRRAIESRLTCELIRVQETDLAVYSDTPPVADAVKQLVIEQRGYLEAYIKSNPEFLATLKPWDNDALAPPLVADMIQASQKAVVGPMAAVAGAIAQGVGCRLCDRVGEVIIENGGDIYLDCRQATTIAVFAGTSPLSMKLGLQFDPKVMPLGVCTSSGRIGHSKSFGKADAVVVVSSSCALADAAATAVANRVGTAKDIDAAIAWGRTIAEVEGIVVILGDKIGLWGKINIVGL